MRDVAFYDPRDGPPSPPASPPSPAAASTASVPTASAPSGDADAAPAVVRAPPGSHIYFAYGSNVGTKTITGVRGVKPSASYPAILRDYRLVFNVPGLPYVEPGFASVKPVLPGASPDDDTTDQLARYEREVHGVAHVVTEEEWRVILRTESGYAREEVTLREFLPGVDAPARLIEATTLVYPDIASGGELLPSARYIDLLREGAAEWNLDEGWQRYLRDRVRSYDPAGDPMRTAGAAVAAASLAPLAVASAPLGIAAAARGALERVGGLGIPWRRWRRRRRQRWETDSEPSQRSRGECTTRSGRQFLARGRTTAANADRGGERLEDR